LTAQNVVVFYDADMHDHDFTVSADVRMGILVRRCAVSRPSRMTDANVAGQWLSFQQPAQFGDSPRFPADFDRVRSEHCDSRTVVASILQPMQALEKKICNRPISDVSNNAAHGFILHTRPGAAQKIRQHLTSIFIGTAE
jgi:hypothetical protein